MTNAEYQVKTNKTTPYWNCPTFTLKKKVEEIEKMIEKVATISGKQLDYIEVTRLQEMLKELKRVVKNQISDREKQ